MLKEIQAPSQVNPDWNRQPPSKGINYHMKLSGYRYKKAHDVLGRNCLIDTLYLRMFRNTILAREVTDVDFGIFVSKVGDGGNSLLMMTFANGLDPRCHCPDSHFAQ